MREKRFQTKNGALTSNYYLKNTSEYETEKLVSLLNTVKYETVEYTVGPKSLPKGELIYYSNLLLNGGD